MSRANGKHWHLTIRAIAVTALALASFSAAAEDFPGGPAPTDAEFEKGFGQSTGLSQADKDTADADRMRIGGSLWSELLYAELDPALSAGTDSYFANPHSLWLYLDARLKRDVRGVAKLRAIYDPTLATGKTSTDLEELKFLFNARKSVFFTVGKQKIKWGSGKFWNPTDLLNDQARNFLYTQDLRSGVSLIKTHVPIGASNFYLVQKLDDARQPEDVRHAIRAEIPVATAELAASALLERGKDPVFGLDLSTALWELDAYTEVAYSAGNSRTTYGLLGPSTVPDRNALSWVLGLNYEGQHNDNDTFVLALEYFNQNLGYSDPADYPFVVAAGAYTPFYLSGHYGMFMVLLPKPGTWNDVTFTLFNLVNLTDKSMMSRLEALLQASEDLRVNLAFGYHYGKSNGEFKLGGQTFDAAARLMIDF